MAFASMSGFDTSEADRWELEKRRAPIVHILCHNSSNCAIKNLSEYANRMNSKSEENQMGECEALIRRRKMLLEKISKMNHEVEMIDQRLDFLGKMAISEQIEHYHMQHWLMQEVS